MWLLWKLSSLERFDNFYNSFDKLLLPLDIRLRMLVTVVNMQFTVVNTKWRMLPSFFFFMQFTVVSTNWRMLPPRYAECCLPFLCSTQFTVVNAKWRFMVYCSP